MIEQSLTPRTTAPPPAMSAWRIRFVSEAPAGANILRRFTDPVAALAICEPLSNADLSSFPRESDNINALSVVHLPNPRAASISSAGANWLAIGAGGSLPIMIPLEDGRLYWRPSSVLLEGNIKAPEPILTAVAEFAFYEGQLRRLEHDLRPFEAAAPTHAAIAFQIRESEKTCWPRLIRIAEQLAQLRLTAARLEPRAYCPPRDLPAASRRIVIRLAARADIEDRLEALSARLEACEDLYEGATDRITDHTWAIKGNRLEIAIVVLLLIEGILLVAELAVNLLHGRG